MLNALRMRLLDWVSDVSKREFRYPRPPRVVANRCFLGQMLVTDAKLSYILCLP